MQNINSFTTHFFNCCVGLASCLICRFLWFCFLVFVILTEERMFEGIFCFYALARSVTQHLLKKINKIFSILYHMENFVKIFLLITLELLENATIIGYHLLELFNLDRRKVAKKIQNLEKLIPFAFPFKERLQ